MSSSRRAEIRCIFFFSSRRRHTRLQGDWSSDVCSSDLLACPISDPAEIATSLIAQVTGTVRWRESVVFMANAGVDSFHEIGAGKVLSGLVKRITAGATGTAIGTPDDVAAFKSARGK